MILSFFVLAIGTSDHDSRVEREEIHSAMASPWVAQMADIYDRRSKRPLPQRSGIYA
jgi:hypothetical protein